MEVLQNKKEMFQYKHNKKEEMFMEFMMVLALVSGWVFSEVVLSNRYSNKLKAVVSLYTALLAMYILVNPPVHVEENNVNVVRESVDEVMVGSLEMIDSSIENKEHNNMTYFEVIEKFKEVSSENYTEEDLDNYRTETFTNENQRMLWVMSDKGISGIGLSDDEEVSSEEDVIELFKKAGSKINVVQGYVIGNDMSKSQAVFLMITKGFLMHLSKLCGLIISAYIGFSIISSINTSIANCLNSIEEKKLKKEKRIADLEEQLKEVKLLRKELKAMKRYNKKKANSIEIEME